MDLVFRFEVVRQNYKSKLKKSATPHVTPLTADDTCGVEKKKFIYCLPVTCDSVEPIATC